MSRLAIYKTKPTETLISQYELACVDLSNLHSELADSMYNLHQHYLEVFAGSNGKSVAEKNREADYSTRLQYAEVLKLRGEINQKATLKDLYAQLISWRSGDKLPSTQLEYPPNYDEGIIGNGHR